MKVELSKIKSYIGFAIKSRNIKFGVDEILKMKHCEIVLFSKSLAKSSTDKLMTYSAKTNSPIFDIDANDFANMFDGNENVKAVAVIDKNLAVAIKKIMTE